MKRNIQSQVTYEGWLCKLEGGALKQWKQRWCVLADFCLFFYKGTLYFPHFISWYTLENVCVFSCLNGHINLSKFMHFKTILNNNRYYLTLYDWAPSLSLLVLFYNLFISLCTASQIYCKSHVVYQHLKKKLLSLKYLIPTYM